MLMRLALVLTAEAVAPMVTKEAVEDSEDTKLTGRHI